MNKLFAKASAPSRSPTRLSTNENNNQSMDSNDLNSENNFWNIKGFKSALNRCDDGFKLGEKLRECVSDLVKIEESYSKSLKTWEKTWIKYLNNESTEYQSGKNTWIGLLKLGSDIGDVHNELSNRLQKACVESIKNWLEENYKKSFLHFVKTKEFEKQFNEAQKSWKEAMDKIETAKKDFFKSDKNLREIETNHNLKYSTGDCNTVMKRESESRLDKAKIDKERMCKRYNDEIENLKLCEPRYKNEMTSVFNDTQMFEEKRLKYFKEVYSNCLEIISSHIKSEKIDNIIQDYTDQIGRLNYEDDLKWWSNNHGAGMPLELPKPEVPL